MHLMPLLAENSLFKAVGNIFHPLFVAVAYVLAFIYGIVPNYAAAITLLTVVIMVLLTPLTIKSTRSMLAMQKLQPEMQKLRQKYKGAENREQLNQEMMRLYRENNVSPTGGCLPMFLQMPALIVLYDTIRGLTNTIKRGTVFPKGTVLANGAVANAGQKCAAKVCAVPRYIPSHSAMYHHLVTTPGVMKSIGLNLAAKPLTHHAVWYDYIPYFALVLVAVGLQYFQMAQMTRRNKKNQNQQQVPQQMQTMQRIMPLIFAYIYFLVPAGVVIYMIISSAIRVLTQDLIFRYGLVQAPRERTLAATVKARLLGAGVAGPAGTPGAIAAESSVTSTKGARPPGTGSPNGASSEGARGTTPGQKRPGAKAPSGGGPRPAANGRGQRSSNGAAAAPAPKAHPRSKAKRTRKAR